MCAVSVKEQHHFDHETVDMKYGAKILWDKLTNGGKNTDALKAKRDKEKAEALRKDRGFKN